MDPAILFLCALYGIYGLFCVYVGYMVLIRKVFQFVNGVDTSVERRIKNKQKFSRDFGIPYMLMGICSLCGIPWALMYGAYSMCIFFPILLIGFYISFLAKRVGDKIRNGVYG